MNEIELVQKPVIKHQLGKIGESVTKRIEELNLSQLIATDETIQSLKTLRADLNTEFDDWEKQRKAIKQAVASPYQDFETTYKGEISEKYENAVNILKNKIQDFEIKVKEEKLKETESYFNELCQSEEIDFVSFSQTGITINLSTSLKKYRDQCNEFIERVKSDIQLINTDQFSVEIMAEYKSNGLNASKAITDIRDRKERERLEKERQHLEKTSKRESQLRSLAMVYNSMVKSFIFIRDETIFIKQSDIESLSNEDWNKIYAELEFSVKEFQESQTKDEAPKSGEPVKQETKPAEQLKAPVPFPKEEEILDAKFIAHGTLSQLLSIGEFMKSNNINYENLD